MKRGRGLGEEEARLWASVARSAIPLPGRRLPTLPDPPPTPTADTIPVVAVSEARAGQPHRGAASSRPEPPLHPIERPVRRKLARGRLAIEARIDLHDKTEAMAHFALLSFLRNAQGLGLRHVLVITGRGASLGSRGALRRALPHWFDTPDFRRLVAGFESAARGHGGEGAFYVRVRRR